MNCGLCEFGAQRWRDKGARYPWCLQQGLADTNTLLRQEPGFSCLGLKEKEVKAQRGE
jgi:hypothetical protein